MKTYNLEIKWSISKGRETCGYNICSLWDINKKYQTYGGGYDMLGTVFAQWLFANFKERIIKTCMPATRTKPNCYSNCDGYYGFFHSQESGNYWLDGACGFECMTTIAKAIGLDIQKIYNRKYTTLKNIIVTDKEAE
jgi:hypothetical protein